LERETGARDQSARENKRVATQFFRIATAFNHNVSYHPTSLRLKHFPSNKRDGSPSGPQRFRVRFRLACCANEDDVSSWEHTVDAS
jgi:hypothetical protein